MGTDGFKTLTDTLSQYANKVQEGIKNRLAEAANELAEEVKSNAHGTVADSVKVNLSSDGLSAVISADSPYALYCEYGVHIPEIKPKEKKALHFVKDGKEVFAKSAQAHTIAPRPFMNPALEYYKPLLMEKLAKAIK